MSIEVYYEYHRGQVASQHWTSLTSLAVRRRQLQAQESNAERLCILNLAAVGLTKIQKPATVVHCEIQSDAWKNLNATSYTKSAVRCQRFSTSNPGPRQKFPHTSPRYKSRQTILYLSREIKTFH